MILSPYPYNSPSKLRFFPLIRGEKVGFWFLRDKTNWFLDSLVGVRFYMPHNCYWRFVAHEASLIAPGGIIFPASNDEVPIQQLIFFLEFWAGVLPFIFSLYMKCTRKSFPHFTNLQAFQRYLTLKFSKLSKSPDFSHPFLKKSFENLSKGIRD